MFNKGDIVYHKRWGAGRVIHCQGGTLVIRKRGDTINDPPRIWFAQYVATCPPIIELPRQVRVLDDGVLDVIGQRGHRHGTA